MIEASGFNFNNNIASRGTGFTNAYSYSPRYTGSIFSGPINNAEAEDNELKRLEEELQAIKDEQGIFSGLYNEIKESTGIGASAAKCEDAIDKYKKGELSFEDALKEIENFDTKQDNGLNLLANIATSFAAIGAVTAAAATIASCGILAPLAIGLGVGAIAKAGFKTIDRATNKKVGDDFDAKQITKDALSGAVTGAIAAATMGTGTAHATLKESLIQGAKSSAKTGAITGAVAGSSNYVIDCAFEKDKDFKFDELLTNTAINSAVGATVGGIVGSTSSGLKYSGAVTHGGKVIVDGQLAHATARDALLNGTNSAAHKSVNRLIKDVTHIA